VAVLLALAGLAGAQPYAPEYFPQRPWYLPPALQAPPETPPQQPAVDPAAQRKVEAIRASMRGEDAPAADPDGPAGERLLSAADIGKILVWLALIIAAILLLGAAMRRWGKKTPLLAGASLAKVLGRVYLDRGLTLHFVETAGKVLVIGAAQNHIALLSAFDKNAFDSRELTKTDENRHQATHNQTNPQEFLKQLDATAARLRRDTAAAGHDPEITALQQDIARLQRHLREEAREYPD
jgi:flagellar biogenesis protein FliO